MVTPAMVRGEVAPTEIAWTGVLRKMAFFSSAEIETCGTHPERTRVGDLGHLGLGHTAVAALGVPVVLAVTVEGVAVALEVDVGTLDNEERTSPVGTRGEGNVTLHVDVGVGGKAGEVESLTSGNGLKVSNCNTSGDLTKALRTVHVSYYRTQVCSPRLLHFEATPLATVE